MGELCPPTAADYAADAAETNRRRIAEIVKESRHVVTLDTRSETHEGSHGVEHTRRYYVLKCSCGWAKEVFRGFMDSRQAEQRAREHTINHKLDVIMERLNIKFEES